MLFFQTSVRVGHDISQGLDREPLSLSRHFILSKSLIIKTGYPNPLDSGDFLCLNFDESLMSLRRKHQI